MKYRYVFLLGRPGCGKSAIYRELEKRILESDQATNCERIDDFPKVWDRLHGDDALEKVGKERIYSRRTDDGGYMPLDPASFLREITGEVNEDVLRIDRPKHIIFIEFARTSYVEAMRCFDQGILDNCTIIYMEVSFDTCWERNVARHEGTMKQEGDDHYVFREVMESIYRYDDQDALVVWAKEEGIRVLVVDNEAEGMENLGEQVDELFEVLL